ncbi:hypothetical protein DR950_33515 [Kitasatospora xanthocidica]|uniref:Uncharacterized protein n=1 Tax=Kitasatospora xanthocidica TaxID=83382 RepID=A0A373A3I9_9ACTN|nr:hypothetical protein [Kitasatospora xanthocidica]RGD62005.1 hypothetical protein DR950_33515 [Kitasatospora xanthocidica]
MNTDSTTTDDSNTDLHEWVIAAYVPVDTQGAAYARRRGVYRVPATTKIRSADVICIRCRRPYDEVCEDPCAGADQMLHGGPIGTRKRRPAPEHRHQVAAAENFRKPDPGDAGNRKREQPPGR